MMNTALDGPIYQLSEWSILTREPSPDQFPNSNYSGRIRQMFSTALANAAAKSSAK